MYYLQSRYYDPAIGRFINADTFTTTDANGFLSCNMFAYCENNPVNRSDPSGKLANWIVGGIVGAAVGGIFSAIQGEGFWAGAAQGFVSGMIAGAAIDVALASVATFGLAGVAPAGLISYLGGYYGNIAGEQAKSIVQGKGIVSVDAEMIARSKKAGIVNVGAFAFSAILRYADNGLEPAKKMATKMRTFMNEVKQNIFQFTKASTDVASIHAAAHYAIHATVLTSNNTRRMSGHTQ